MTPIVRAPRLALASLLAVVAWLAPAVPGRAAESDPYLVRDIGQADEPESWYWSRPTDFVRLGSALYFLYDDGVHGRELWRTDLTAAGTGLVADLCSGACGSANLTSAWPGSAVTGGRLVFAADDGVHGTEPWVSDGTPAGTHLLADLRPGLAASAPMYVTASGGLVFFVARDDAQGYGLWRTDGTATGTWLVAPWSSGYFIPIPGAPNGLYFAAQNGADGLWWTDGTPGNLVQLFAGAGWAQVSTPSSPFEFLADGTLLFGTDEALWRTDGTVAGTWQVKSLGPASQYLEMPFYFERAGSAVFFSYTDGKLWRSDGTTAGTYSLPLPVGTTLSLGWAHGHVGGRYFFGATDAAAGRELWTLDGDTPRRVRDVFPGPDSGLWYLPWQGGTLFLGLVDRLLFTANDGVHGVELWTSDGSEAGTTLLVDLTPGGASTVLEPYTFYATREPLAGRLPLITFRPDLGDTLWATDGTAAGTAPVATLRAQRSGLPETSRQSYLGSAAMTCRAEVGNRLLFDATDGTTGREPWVSDGSTSGTVQLGDLMPGLAVSWPAVCTSLGSLGLFGADTTSGTVLWRTDGTSAGTQTVDVSGSPAAIQVASGTRPLPVLGGAACFANGGLARTDGLAVTTLDTLARGYYNWTSGRTLAYFGGDVLVRTDGTPAGTLAIGDSTSGPYGPEGFATDGDRLYFFAGDEAHGQEPWVSDGTPESTHRIADLRPGPGSSIPSDALEGIEASPIAVAGATAFFTADDGVHGSELWATEGTAETTRLVADLFPGPYPSSPRNLVAVGKEVFFVAEDPAHGRELWRSDGTEAGTVLVVDLLPGAGSSLPQDLAAIDGRLYFSAWLPASGRELWILDPATDSPPLLFDLAAGGLSSSPHDFSLAGRRVFFAANDNLHGFEPWAIALRDLFADGFEAGGAARWSGGAP